MTQRTLLNPNTTPRDLWQYKQYLNWRYQDNGKAKPDKIPVNSRTLGNAGTTWPNTWTDIRTAVASYVANPHLSGLGFVLTAHDPIVMLDLDNCIINGRLSFFANDVLCALDTYWEFSPSRLGLRGFVHCRQQPDAIKRTEIEIYSRERFATLTGDVLDKKPIAKVDSLDWFINEFIPKPEETTKNDPQLSSSCANRLTPSSDDAELWEHIFKVNALAKSIFNGDLSNVRGNGDPSRAVILLLNSLAMWTKGDAQRMERMIRQAHLDQSKWHEKRKNQTWLDGRIADAVNYMAARGYK